MDETQGQAAILMGRGLTAGEIAEVLDLPGGEATVHRWRTSSRQFRGVVRYWSEVAEDEQRSALLKELDYLGGMDLDARDRIRVASLRSKIAVQPEQREFMERQLELREREVIAKEKEADRGGRELRVRPSFVVDPLDCEDVEFIAEDVKEG